MSDILGPEIASRLALALGSIAVFTVLCLIAAALRIRPDHRRDRA